MESSCFIRKIRQEKIEKALFLVWQVFQEYEAPDYTQEGAEEFYKSIHDEKYKKELYDYGYEVVKISMKAQTVLFAKRQEG